LRTRGRKHHAHHEVTVQLRGKSSSRNVGHRQGRPRRRDCAVGAQAACAAWRYHTRRRRGETGKMGTASPTLARKRARCPARARSVPCVCVRVCVRVFVCVCVLYIYVYCVSMLYAPYTWGSASPHHPPHEHPPTPTPPSCVLHCVLRLVWC
jgi:hypothetical protein